jgi:uncharacterized surface protein with fasciclin (FAS1) repeats
VSRANLTAALACAGLLLLPACKQDNAPGSSAATTDASKPGDTTLAKAIGSASNLSTVAAALKATGLDAVFDGNASYTVLAPTDEAFGALGDKKAMLTAPENGAAMAAALRDHIVPGTLTPADIGKAIDAAKGEAVKMRTVGNGELAFTKSGSTITVTAPDGSSAKFAGDAVPAKNGVAIPIDALLKKI